MNKKKDKSIYEKLEGGEYENKNEYNILSFR
jgi:hypothetical protein